MPGLPPLWGAIFKTIRPTADYLDSIAGAPPPHLLAVDQISPSSTAITPPLAIRGLFHDFRYGSPIHLHAPNHLLSDL